MQNIILGDPISSGIGPFREGICPETIQVRAIASQKLSRDNGETIFAPRHLDVSHGPLGRDKLTIYISHDYAAMKLW